MKIVFHGTNASTFEQGFAALLDHAHDISAVSDALLEPAERHAFATADVIIGIKLDASMPRPERLRLYHAPAAGTDGIDRTCLPASVPLCNCFGHENAIAEYVMAALLTRFVPLVTADRELRRAAGHRVRATLLPCAANWAIPPWACWASVTSARRLRRAPRPSACA